MYLTISLSATVRNYFLHAISCLNSLEDTLDCCILNNEHTHSARMPAHGGRKASSIPGWCVWVPLCLRACMWELEGCLYSCLLCFWGQGLTAWVGHLDNKLRGTACLHRTPAPTRGSRNMPAFMWVLRVQTQLLVLAWQALYHLSYLPSSQLQGLFDELE